MGRRKTRRRTRRDSRELARLKRRQVDCGKVRYTSRAHAQAAIPGMMKRHPGVTYRAYRHDPCGGWHLTTDTKAK